MNILIVNNSKIPVHLYGGTERVIWDLGKELVKLNCKVSYLVKRGSSCEFADVIAIDDSKEIIDQIPDEVDLVHFHFTPKHLDRVRKPYIITIHGNSNEEAFYTIRILCLFLKIMLGDINQIRLFTMAWIGTNTVSRILIWRESIFIFSKSGLASKECSRCY